MSKGSKRQNIFSLQMGALSVVKPEIKLLLKTAKLDRTVGFLVSNYSLELEFIYSLESTTQFVLMYAPIWHVYNAYYA